MMTRFDYIGCRGFDFGNNSVCAPGSAPMVDDAPLRTLRATANGI